MQELEQMIDARVYAILEAHGQRIGALVPQRAEADTVEAAPYHRVGAGDAPLAVYAPETCPPFDVTKNVLGKLCKRGHEWGCTGQTLLRLPNLSCRTCENESKRERRRAAKTPVPGGG